MRIVAVSHALAWALNDSSRQDIPSSYTLLIMPRSLYVTRFNGVVLSGVPLPLEQPIIITSNRFFVNLEWKLRHLPADGMISAYLIRMPMRPPSRDSSVSKSHKQQGNKITLVIDQYVIIMNL